MELGIDFFGVFFITLVLNFIINAQLVQKHQFVNPAFLTQIYIIHSFLFLAYLFYTIYNPSDSKGYYNHTLRLTDEEWLQTFNTGTDFMYFITYPFVRANLSFPAVMFIFSYVGYLGFIYAYLFFRENLPYRVTVLQNIDFLTLLFFLPNMHFWTSSLGKGSVIFMSLMMFSFAITKPKERWFLLFLGGFITFMVRPHVMAFALVAVLFGVIFSSNKKISGSTKFILVMIAGGILIAASGTILSVANIESTENVVEDFNQFSNQRAQGLADAGSGVDMQNYPLPFKLFTFWFRPLFVDSPNVLGLGSSLENLIYLILFLNVLKRSFWRVFKRAPYVVKMSFMMFILTSIAMTFVMSNLGIIMRQKQMVMYFGFFIIYYYLSEKKRYRHMAYQAFISQNKKIGND